MPLDLIKMGTDALPQLPGFITGVLSTGLVSIILTKSLERADKRKELFASAYKSALAWHEMLYKVRRRAAGVIEERRLVNEFHEIQGELDYYQGIISAESWFLGKSYKKLVSSIKSQTQTLIQEAWKSPVRRPKDYAAKNEKNPNISTVSDSFLTDTRDWFSFWVFPKLFVILRNLL